MEIHFPMTALHTQTECSMSKVDDTLSASPHAMFCETPILWKNVIWMSALHLIFLWVCWATVQGTVSLSTVALFWLYAFASAFGTLAGAHRLWSHRSYRARLPLRILLMVLQTASLQNNLFDWCRNHRVHHRFSETSADPHNSKRGFFFSHMGWLLCRKHPDVKRLGEKVNMEDLLADPVIQFQMRHYGKLALLFWFALPVSLSMYCDESLLVSVQVNCWRYVVSLHNTWLVNSLAHRSGSRPYNRNIQPRENTLVTYFSLGEGYHNYHHQFPFDYSASELGWRQNYNLATAFIDFFAWCGLAYDLRVPSLAMVRNRIEQSGEGSIRTEWARLQERRQPAGAFIHSLVGLVTLTVPVWALAAGRLLYLCALC